MPYIVNFTDSTREPITIYDSTSNKDTSLTFPGRNVTGYGQIIGENFLHLLENFSNTTPPTNPVEGQLWYDKQNGVLNLWDEEQWTAASNIQKSPTEPNVETSKIGELWVDTANQQLRIFTGTRWILVGPAESSIDGLRYGPSVETITDSDNNNRSILTIYIADVPVAIVSKDSFTPKLGISGFSNIRAGINIATPSSTGESNEFATTFLGGFLPKLIGTAKNADALNINDVEVPAGRFLRSDQINTTEYSFNVRNNGGITLGLDSNFNLSTSTTAAKIYNSTSGNSIDIQTNRDGLPSTILRVIDDRVGVNVATPERTLDVDGSVGITETLFVTNTEDTISLTTGSVRISGGASIQQSLIVGKQLTINGDSYVTNLYPKQDITSDLGTSAIRWNNVFAKRISAEVIEGTIEGNITGNANTATNLKNVTSFSLAGDVTSPSIQFDGQVGSYNKVFNTTLTANLIKDKPLPSPNVSENTDFILVYRSSEESSTSTGLLRQTRDTFVADLGVPLGSILPYAGATAPYGYLFCDGSEVERVRYPQLYNAIGTLYNGSAPLVGVDTFRLPDLRGRFPLGKHNMDNGQRVPNITGGFVDAGGGTPFPARVEGIEAETLAATAGSSSVSLTLGNLPEHTHNMTANGVQYAAVRVDTGVSPPAVTGLGPTSPGTAQYLQDSGGIKKPSTDFNLGIPVGIMNPYLTLHYIIRSGPPAFTVT